MPRDPTPNEIASVCRRIQGGWTEAERRKRAACPHMKGRRTEVEAGWRPPVLRSPEGITGPGLPVGQSGDEDDS